MRNQLLLDPYCPAEISAFFPPSGRCQGPSPLSVGCSNVLVPYLALVFFLFVLLGIYGVSVGYKLLFSPNL